MSTFEENKKIVNQVFSEFRKQGFFAKYFVKNCWDCLEVSENVVTYQKCDLDVLRDSGYLLLTWKGDAEKIVQEFQKVARKVSWDGFVGSRIKVYFRP